MSDSETSTTAPAGGFGRKLVDPIIRAVKAELSSARREIIERVKTVRTGLILVAAGTVVGVVTVALLATVAIGLLALVLPVWAASLIIFVVFGAVSGILASVGLRMLRRGLPPTPSDTLAHAKQHLSSALPGHSD